MKIIRETENKLLNRKTVVVSIDKGSTITRKEAKSSLAKKIKVSEDLIIVKDIFNKYGESESIIEAKVYNDKESFNKYARPHLVKRNDFEAVAVEKAPVKKVVKEEVSAEKAPVEEVVKEEAKEVEAQEEKTEEVKE